MFKDIKDNLWLSIQRDKLWFLLNKVKPIESLKPAQAKVEVTSLVSHHDLPLYLTTMKTFFHFSKRKFFVTVFEDGSFTSEDINFLRSFIKGVRFVSVHQADSRLRELLKNKKYCKKFRNKYLMTRKIIDLVFLSLKERILMLDSDLIFFKQPREIIRWVENNRNSSIFISDWQDGYLISRVEAKHCFGLGLVPRLNGGLVGFSSKEVILNFVEKFFKEILELDLCGKRTYFANVEQTILGLLLSKKNNKKRLIRLPQTYLVNELKKDIPGLICRHYVSPIRKELFYPTAISVLKKIVDEERRR